MYTVKKFPYGTFSWADLISTDQAAAREFYTQLMGWGTADVPMGNDQMYTFFTVDGHNVGAVGPMPQQMRDHGHPSVWNNYITVDDVDALVDKVTAAGGKVIAPPFDVFDNGRMMTVQDPSGGTVCFWQPKKSIGAGMVNGTGAMIWNELNTWDAAAATAFYETVIGWTFDKDPNIDYWYIKNNGRYNGGILQMSKEAHGDLPSAWIVYYNVADIDATVAKTKELGGQVMTEIMEAQNAGRFALLVDPTGGTFMAMQGNSPDQWDLNGE